MKKLLPVLTRLLLTVVFSCFGIAGFAQMKVSGTVSDTTGDPLVGATIITSKGGGATTAADGTFTIATFVGDKLTVSYLNYESTSVEVTTKTVYDIRLKSDDAQIDEVVVVGYSTQKKVNLTGAVASIGAEQIESRPIISTSAVLQGMAPGVTVTTQSGAPGGDGGAIRIRGINSFGGSSTSPLVLIDGIEGSMDSLDPNTIESISILKDAASASIYGSRAANGVILVTTKRGSKERFSITYKGHVGWQDPTMLPEAVNAVEFLELTDVMAQNDNSTRIDPEYLELYRKNMGKDADLWPNTDWQKVLLTGSGFSHNHNVTMTAATDRIRILTSFGYVNQEGIIENTDYNRFTFRNNADVEFHKKLSMRLDLNFSSGNREQSPYESTIFNYMNTRPANITDIWSNGNYNGSGLQGSNPIAMIHEGGNNKNNTLRFTGAVSLTYKPWEWLTLEGKVAPRYTISSTHRFKAPITTYGDMEGTIQMSNGQANHELTESVSRTFYGNYNFLLTADKSFGNHNLKLILGAERNTYDNNYLRGYREKFNYPNYDQLDAGELPNQSTNGRRYQWAIQSYFGRLNYNYHDRYLLEANLRIDGSSRFVKSNRWGYFPSVSGAWRISEEAFMENAKDVLTNLKLRASYGTLGNQNLAGSGAATYYPFSENLSVTSTSMNGKLYPIVTLNTLANPNITWETTTATDVGVDISLFGKLNISADWYRKMTKDILMKLDISPAIGLSAPYQNAGKVRNTGWELSIGYANQWRDFSFDVTANISDVHNKIVDMQGKTSTNGVMRNEEGHSIASIYGMRSLGYIQTQEQADWVNANLPQFGSTVHPGDLRYADLNHDGEITDDDREIIGSTVPRYTYSMNLNFGWKGLRLGMMFQGVGKVDGYLNYYYVMPSVQGGTFRKAHLDYWRPDNPNAATPRLTADPNNWKDSSFWMKSAAYLRLKNIQLGYELPSKWTKRIGMRSVLIYVNAQNLFTITNFWDGYDPEVAYGGSSGSEYDMVSVGGASAANNYPQVKIYTIGVDIKF